MRQFLKLATDRPRGFFLFAAFCGLYLQCFILPAVPTYQGEAAPILLLEARRMLEGQVIYQDFFEFLLPGTQVVYLALFRLCGVRAWIPNLLFVVLGVGLAWAGLEVSRRLLRGGLAFLPSLLFLAFALSNEVSRDATHHWFSALAVMAALVPLMEKRDLPRIAAAGALCGLAALFTQSRGAMGVLGIAVFLLWEAYVRKQNRHALLKAEACLFGSSLAVLAPPLIYLAAKVGLRHFFYCTITYPMEFYPRYYWNTPAVYMAEPPELSFPLALPAVGIWLFIHLLVPLVYLLFFVRSWRKSRVRPEEPWDRLMLVSLVGLFLFLGIAYSPEWVRLCSVSLPALIVFVWFLSSAGRIGRAAAKLLGILAVLVVLVQAILVQATWHRSLNLPPGRVAFMEVGRYEQIRWLAEQARVGEYFFQADDANLYFVLGLRNPTEVSFLTATAYTRPEQVSNVIEALERHRVRFVVWSAALDAPRDRAADDPLGPLRTYLRTHYHLAKSFSPDLEEAWERNP